MRKSVLVLVGALLLGGCDNFDLYSMLDGHPPGTGDDDGAPLTLGVESISLYAGGTYAFSATGGIPPYVYALASGTDSIDASTGVYTAPGAPGTDVVSVTDFVGTNATATVVILDAILFTISPPAVELAIGTTLDFTTTGGVAPVVFEMVSGAGEIGAHDGRYTAPLSPGTDVVRATDARGSRAEATVSVTEAIPDELAISPLAITVYVNNTVDFAAFGGKPPYGFTLESGAGSVNAASGRYQAPPTPGTDVVRVEDGLGATSDATVTILAPLTITPAAVQLTVGSSFGFTAAGGVPPYAFTVVSGTGTIDGGTGWYTAPGAPDSDVIQLEDALGNTRTASVVITAPAVLVISPSTITVNAGTDTLFTATGGQAPYEYTVLAGTGTVGLTTGVYTAAATPEAAAVRVTDDLGATSDAAITVVSGGPLAISPGSVTVSQSESVTFSAAGGTPGYVYSVVSGGGFVNATTGLYTAPATLGPSATVRVTDTLMAYVEATVTIAPRAPAGVVADGDYGGPQDIRLTWVDQSMGEEGFSVERKMGAGAFAEVHVAGPGETVYDDLGLTPNKVYVYRVRSYVGAIYSAYSPEAYAISNP